MAFCNNCGYNLDHADRECPECGNSVLSRTGESFGRNIDRALSYAEKNVPGVKNQFQTVNYRHISPAMFLIALFCLFMPFASFSCGGQEITVRGLELATGKEFMGERIEGSGWAVFFILVLLSGLCLSFWKDQRKYLFSIIAAVAALFTLIGISVGISNEMSGYDMMGLVGYRLRSGYYLMLISILVAGGINVIYFRQPKKTGNNSIYRQDEGRDLRSTYSSDRSVGEKTSTINSDVVATRDEYLFNDEPFLVESEWEEEVSKDKTIKWAGGTYTGQVKNNIPDGQGRIKMPNKTNYEGEWKAGKPHNYGKITYSSGDEYIGCFFEGKRHGFGVYIKQGGTKIVGEWEKGEYLKKDKKRYHKYLYCIIYEELYYIPMLADRLNISEDQAIADLKKIIAAGWLSNAEIDTNKKQIIIPGLNHGIDEPLDGLQNDKIMIKDADASSDSRNCKACGGKLKQDARFCPACGFSAENTNVQNNTLDPMDNKTTCISCSKPLKTGAKFCASCGQYQH